MDDATDPYLETVRDSLNLHDAHHRRATHANTCVDSATGLRRFAGAHGVSLTALLDALGHVCGALAVVRPDELNKYAPSLSLAIDAARKFDNLQRFGSLDD